MNATVAARFGPVAGVVVVVVGGGGGGGDEGGERAALEQRSARSVNVGSAPGPEAEEAAAEARKRVSVQPGGSGTSPPPRALVRDPRPGPAVPTGAEEDALGKRGWSVVMSRDAVWRAIGARSRSFLGRFEW